MTSLINIWWLCPQFRPQHLSHTFPNMAESFLDSLPVELDVLKFVVCLLVSYPLGLGFQCPPPHLTPCEFIHLYPIGTFRGILSIYSF